MTSCVCIWRVNTEGWRAGEDKTYPGDSAEDELDDADDRSDDGIDGADQYGYQYTLYTYTQVVNVSDRGTCRGTPAATYHDEIRVRGGLRSLQVQIVICEIRDSSCGCSRRRSSVVYASRPWP